MNSTELKIEFVETKVERMDAINTETTSCLAAIFTLQQWITNNASYTRAMDARELGQLQGFIQATQRKKLRNILEENEPPKISDRSLGSTWPNQQTGYDAIDSQLSGLPSGDSK